MKKQTHTSEQQKIKDTNIEKNAIYSDPKDSANMQTVPQPKDYDEIEY